MKKFQVYGALMLLGASVMLTSCFKNEEDDIFDKSASERLDDAKVYYSDILTDKGGKWQMEYYANGDEHGYVYLMTFNKNGQVTISGQNEYIGYEYNPVSSGTKLFKSETSLWEVVADNGPVLSFNSYNRTFHIFSSPYDIPPYGENATDESGEGHLGDYEFDLMKYSNDTLYIEGKKHEIKMIMTRIDPNIDDEVYMNYVTAMADSFFHAKMPIVFMNLPNGKRYGIMDGATQIVTMWDWDLDRISYSTTHNAIVNHDGFAMMDPYQAGDYTVQRFVRQSDGSLYCIENPQVTVDAGNLATDVLFNHDNIKKCELDTTKLINSWNMSLSSMTGEFLRLYNAMKAEYNKGNRKMGTITIEYDLAQASYVLNIQVLPSASQKLYVSMKITPQYDGEDDVTFHLGEPSLPNIVAAVPSMATFIDFMDGTKFHLSAENLLAPTVMTMASASNADDSVQLVVR